LVALGPGISILPRISIRPDDNKNLVYREIGGRVPTREVLIVRHLQRYQTKGTELFLQVLRAAATELAPTVPVVAGPATPA
jgi:LysR family hydrogen peroxide-inducible transcriptional activator